MNHHVILWITNLADSGVILPLAVLLTGALWYLESARAAWLYGRTFLLCLGVMTVLKVLFISCGHVIGSSIVSPSGHASLATLFFGSLAVLVWARRPGVAGVVIGIALIDLIIAIAISRVLLGAHNLPEVLVGVLIGLVALVLFAWPYLRLPHPDLRLRRLALVMLPAFLLTYGTILPAEHLLRDFIPLFNFGLCAAPLPAHGL